MNARPLRCAAALALTALTLTACGDATPASTDTAYTPESPVT